MFWGVQKSSSDAMKFSFKAGPAACAGPEEMQFLMGGVAMAAAVEALEAATEKPLIWATIQFLAGGKLGDEVDIQVETLGGGRSIVHAGASLRVGERDIQRVQAALGGRDGFPQRQFIEMPAVPRPEDCPPKPDDSFVRPGNLLSQFEKRVAFVNSDTGVEHLWLRPVFETQVTASLLALVSDFILGSHELTRGGKSLDNTLRIFSPRDTGWILCVSEFSGFSGGAALGVQYQFAEDGTLLSASSQSGLLPFAPPA